MGEGETGESPQVLDTKIFSVFVTGSRILSSKVGFRSEEGRVSGEGDSSCQDSRRAGRRERPTCHHWRCTCPHFPTNPCRAVTLPQPSPSDCLWLLAWPGVITDGFIVRKRKTLWFELVTSFPHSIVCSFRNGLFMIFAAAAVAAVS